MKKILTILGVALLALTLSVGGASAAKLITGADIRNGSIGLVDLSPQVHAKLDKAGKMGPRGAQGPAGQDGAAGQPGAKGDPGDPASDVLGGLAGHLSQGVLIENIGGSFAQRATQVGSFNLEPGTYLVSASANFDRIDNAQSSSPVLQLAVRGAASLTAWSGNYPATGDREQSASVTQLVTVSEAGSVNVFAFGYNNDGSSAGSGNYTAAVDVTAVRVGPAQP